jgi:hypothetical protein
VEVLVAMTLTGIVVAGTLRALSAQKKFYARQARILDARHAMRAAVTIISSELREVSGAGGDFYTIASDTVAFRSTVGFGIACAVNVGAGQLSLEFVSGHFRLEAGDSILVYVENGRRDSDDFWTVAVVNSIDTSGPACAHAGAADLHVNTTGSLSGIWVGAPVRLFRPYEYGLFEMEGVFWLGRRNLATTDDYTPVAGPLAPPTDGGLEIKYYDSAGVETNDPTAVTRVDIMVRAPTYRSIYEPDYRELSTSTYLRNDG